MKWCLTCMVELDPATNWPEHQRRQHKHRCRTCFNKKCRISNETWREKNREKARIDAKAWREKNPDKYRAQLDAAKAKRKEQRSE